MKFRLYLHQPAMSDRLSTKPYKGSRDFFPPEMRSRDWAFSVLSNAVESFGFEKIDAPVLEPIEIYLAKTSQEIVEQQMYSFTDRGDRQVAIRPEMTPTVSRMVRPIKRNAKTHTMVFPTQSLAIRKTRPRKLKRALAIKLRPFWRS